MYVDLKSRGHLKLLKGPLEAAFKGLAMITLGRPPKASPSPSPPAPAKRARPAGSESGVSVGSQRSKGSGRGTPPASRAPSDAGPRKRQRR